jgi:hypothetical protein
MSAKKLILIGISLSWLAAHAATNGNQPQGRLIELHSCEVYAGACMVSSQSELGGRNALQIWDFAGGSWQGVDLKGLQMAVLESSLDNLAAPSTRVDEAIVYLPENANARQRASLLGWVKARDSQLSRAKIQARVVPISLTSSVEGIRFQAGQFASLHAAALGDCQNRVCGESLWYEPSTPTSLFTVALNADSRINEPLIKLTWNDFGKRSVFVARFGVTPTTQNQYVQSWDWCGPTGLLF